MLGPRDFLPPGVRHVVRRSGDVRPRNVVQPVRGKGRVGRVGEGEDTATATAGPLLP